MGRQGVHDDSHAARWMAALYAARHNFKAGVQAHERIGAVLDQSAIIAQVLRDIDALPSCPEPDDPPGMLR